LARTLASGLIGLSSSPRIVTAVRPRPTADAARALTEHLESVILFWPYMAVVAAFQHWIYTNHAAASNASACDDKWEELWNRFMKGIDYSGLDKYKRMYWQRQLHIYQVPFYYIEYGLAQLGAVQVWANSLKDHAKALADYRQALKLGYTVTLPELYATAGIKLAFDAETLSEAVNLADKTIIELEAVQ
jgi:oligoendopeptidase F